MRPVQHLVILLDDLIQLRKIAVEAMKLPVKINTLVDGRLPEDGQGLRAILCALHMLASAQRLNTEIDETYCRRVLAQVVSE